MKISFRVIFFFKFILRLSKIAGSKLTTNKSDIKDLNDDNRPTKLAEKFGQLYDDAWTDSIEELTEGERRLDDRTAISILLRIVMVEPTSSVFEISYITLYIHILERILSSGSLGSSLLKPDL